MTSIETPTIPTANDPEEKVIPIVLDESDAYSRSDDSLEEEETYLRDAKIGALAEELLIELLKVNGTGDPVALLFIDDVSVGQEAITRISTILTDASEMTRLCRLTIQYDGEEFTPEQISALQAGTLPMLEQVVVQPLSPGLPGPWHIITQGQFTQSRQVEFFQKFMADRPDGRPGISKNIALRLTEMGLPPQIPFTPEMVQQAMVTAIILMAYFDRENAPKPSQALWTPDLGR